MSIGAVTTTYTPEELAGLLGQHLPTEEQSAIISSALQPLLVIAGAGSGKTATMADRVVWLVANGLVRPDEILGVDVHPQSRRGTGRPDPRQLAKWAGPQGALPQEADNGRPELVEPKVSTYHSYANGLVSDYGLRLGIERDAVLLEQPQSWQLASQCVEAYDGPIEHLVAAKSTLVGSVMQFASECSEHLVTPEQAAEYLEAEVERVAALPYIDGSTKPAKQDVRKLLDRLRTRITVAGLAAATTGPSGNAACWTTVISSRWRRASPAKCRRPANSNAVATKWCCSTNSKTPPTPRWCCSPNCSGTGTP